MATVLAEYREYLSTKTLDNALIPLRRLLDAAVANRVIPKPPAQGIKNLPYQKPTPDPFEAREVRDQTCEAFADKVRDAALDLDVVTMTELANGKDASVESKM